MFCEYCGKRLQVNCTCNCPEALQDGKAYYFIEEEVYSNEVLFCEYCGKKLNENGKCTCEDFLDDIKIQEQINIKVNKNIVSKEKTTSNLGHIKLLLGALAVVIVLFLIIRSFISPSKDNSDNLISETTINEDLSENSIDSTDSIELYEDDVASKETMSEDVSFENIYFTEETLTDEAVKYFCEQASSRVEKYLNNSEDLHDIDNQNINWSECYFMSKDYAADASEFSWGNSEYTDYKLVVYGEFYNYLTEQNNYWMKFWDNVYEENGEFLSTSDAFNVVIEDEPLDEWLYVTYGEYYDISLFAVNDTFENVNTDNSQLYATADDIARVDVNNFEDFAHELLINTAGDESPTIGTYSMEFLEKLEDAPECDKEGTPLTENKVALYGIYYDDNHDMHEWVVIFDDIMFKNNECSIEGECTVVFEENYKYLEDLYSSCYTFTDIFYLF